MAAHEYSKAMQAVTAASGEQKKLQQQLADVSVVALLPHPVSIAAGPQIETLANNTVLAFGIAANTSTERERSLNRVARQKVFLIAHGLS
jgi:hypothetical protein